MNADELNKLIQLKEPEGLKIDFKEKFYEVNHSDSNVSDKHWNELVKDILALANGNIGTLGKDGFLIIGIADKLNSAGTRDVFDIANIPVTEKQILERVNSVSKSKLPDLHIESMFFQEKNIWIIRIPPSPYLYETSRPLTTVKKTYHEHSVFIRRKEGIGIASTEERLAIISEKSNQKNNRVDIKESASIEQNQTEKEPTQWFTIRYGYDGQELHDTLELEAIASEVIYAVQNKNDINFGVELTELSLLNHQLQKYEGESLSPQDRISKIETLNRIKHLQKIKTVIQNALVVVTSSPIFEHCADPQYLGLFFRGLGLLLLGETNLNQHDILSLDLWYSENSRISTVLHLDLKKLNMAEKLEDLMSYYLSHKWDIFALPSFTAIYEYAIPAIIIEHLNQKEIKEFNNLDDTLNLYKWKVGLH